jgi:AcrR family transcriptional regulator
MGMTINKKAKISEATKQNLITAFWRIYSEKKIERISITEITAKAGYHRGTFYVYFENIYDILNHIEQQILDDITKELRPVVNSILNPGLGEIGHFLIEILAKHGQYFVVLLGPHGDLGFYSRLRKTVAEDLRPIINRVNPAKKKQAIYTLEFIMAGVFNSVTLWLNNDKDIPLSEFFAIYSNIAHKGIIEHIMQLMD